MQKILDAIEATRALFESDEANGELIFIMIYIGQMSLSIDEIKAELEKNDNYIVTQKSDLTIEVFSKLYPDRVEFATITDC